MLNKMETIVSALKTKITGGALKGFDLLSAGSKLVWRSTRLQLLLRWLCLMAEKVKCRDCGFLAKHGLSSRAPTPRFYEIDTEDRSRPAEFFRHTPEGFLGSIETHLVCFLHKADLMAESVLDAAVGGDEAVGGATEAGALYAIAQDRECEWFSPHIPGFSPMEHAEVYRMQRLEQDRREFEERLARHDEDVHTALVKTQQSFQLERERAQQPTTNLMKRLTWLAVGLAAVQVLIGLTPESLIVKAIIRLWRLIFG